MRTSVSAINVDRESRFRREKEGGRERFRSRNCLHAQHVAVVVLELSRYLPAEHHQKLIADVAARADQRFAGEMVYTMRCSLQHPGKPFAGYRAKKPAPGERGEVRRSHNVCTVRRFSRKVPGL